MVAQTHGLARRPKLDDIHGPGVRGPRHPGRRPQRPALRLHGHCGFLPPRFRGTMGEEDKRLPRMAHGVGVVIGDGARFFTMDQMKNPISLDWGGRQMNLSLSPVDKVPAAIWEDESRPFQLFPRWYGFSYTYPGCDIWGAEEGS